MKKILQYAVVATLILSGNRLYAQHTVQMTSHTITHATVTPTDTVPHIIRRYPTSHNIVISRYRYIGQQSSRYNSVINQVYQPVYVLPGGTSIPEAERATYDDSAMLTSTVNSVLDEVRNNYTESMEEYVDTVNELSKLKGLQWINSRVRKTDVYGLVTNLTLLKNIFAKDVFDKEDVEMVSYLLGTNDSIIANMNVVNYEFLMLSSAGVRLAVVLSDTLNNPIPSANCYFLLKSTWRSLQNCDQCPFSFSGQPCNNVILNELEQKNDGKIMYNALTPQQDIVQLPYGPYHIVIAVNGNIYYHQVENMDISTPVSLALNLSK
ncbi:MAG: hypothetical protein ABJA35_01150 [Parafilimonas sp.]